MAHCAIFKAGDAIYLTREGRVTDREEWGCSLVGKAVVDFSVSPPLGASVQECVDLAKWLIKHVEPCAETTAAVRFLTERAQLETKAGA